MNKIIEQNYVYRGASEFPVGAKYSVTMFSEVVNVMVLALCDCIKFC